MPSATIQKRDSVDLYLAAFDRLERDRRGEPAWLRQARRRGIDSFATIGFPTTREEEWRFTNVAPIAEARFDLPSHDGVVPRQAVESFVIPGVDGPLVVFVNGRFAPTLSSVGRGEDHAAIRGVSIESLAGLLRRDPGRVESYLARYASSDERGFTGLNTALFEDGVVIETAANLVLEAPIQVVFLSMGNGTPSVSCPRVLMVAGPNSQARLIEIFACARSGPTWTNAVTELVAGDGAVVDHYRLQRESEAAFHIGHTHLHLSRSSHATSHAVSMGGLLARHETVAVLAGEGVECTLNGLYLVDGRRLVDNRTEIDHARPNGTSYELYKGILGGRARAVFNGRIRVRPDAQKTNARQTNKTLLLSDDAQINTKPQLEIRANDVKCTHGATVGQLSEDALFYLQTRGIGKQEARSLLVRAFAMDVVNRMALEPVRQELDRLLAARLPGSLAEKAFA